MEQYFQAGIITSPHGIKGEAKVFPTTDDPERFRQLKKVLIDSGTGKQPLNVQYVKLFKRSVIIKFEGIDDIDGVEKYRGKSLWVAREDAVKLKKDEYYVADLIGMKVVSDTGEEGVLKDVMETGANAVYAVDFEKYGEVLIPAIRRCILDVDVEACMMKVHLLDGLV